MRAIRWKIFFGAGATEGFALEINIPTVVGFTGLALFVGRRDDSALSDRAARRPAIFLTTCGMGRLNAYSMLGVHDFAHCGCIPGNRTKRLAYYGSFREAGLFLSGMVAALAVGAIVVHRSGEALASWVERKLVICFGAGTKDCHPYSRIPRRAEHHSQPDVIPANCRCVSNHVVHDCGRL